MIQVLELDRDRLKVEQLIQKLRLDPADLVGTVHQRYGRLGQLQKMRGMALSECRCLATHLQAVQPELPNGLQRRIPREGRFGRSV